MKQFSIGIGCRQQVSAEAIETAVLAALGKLGEQRAGAIESIASIASISTIDSKTQEPGLLAFCARHALMLHGFSREAIAACPHDVLRATASQAVQARFGVDGICEPCALLAAPGGRLVVGKTALRGVTVAIARLAEFCEQARGARRLNPTIRT